METTETNGDKLSADEDTEMEEDDEGSNSSEDLELDDEQEAITLQQLQNAVTSNPFDYNTHIQLIDQAKKCAELDILRIARQRMSEIFPLTSELWKSWIVDETGLLDKTNQNEVAKIVGLYERAVKDYWSVDLWIDYALFLMTDFSSEEAIAPVRKVFERALEDMRYHATEGKQLWDSYRDMEQGYLMYLAGAAESGQLMDAKTLHEQQYQNILSIFKRELRCPLIGIEDTYKDYLEFISNNPDAEVETGYAKAKKQVEEILPFELQVAEADDNSRYKVFMAYIDHEINGKRNGNAVVSLFERALVHYCLSTDLWGRYLNYMDRQMRPACSAAESLSTHERSVRNISWSFELWISYFRAAELHRADDQFIKSLFLRIKTEICSLPLQVVDIWLAYLSYLRRKLVTSELTDASDHPHVADLRLAFSDAVSELQETDAEKRIERYWATVEAEILDNVVKGRELWDAIMKDFQSSSKLWLEYVNFERRFGDEKSCRKVLSSSMRRNLDEQDAIVQKWVEFEYEVGSIEAVMDMQDACRVSLKRISDRLAKQEKIRIQEEAKLSAPRKNFRNRPELGEEEEKPVTFKRQISNADLPDGKRKRTGEVSKSADGNANGFKIPEIPTKLSKSTASKPTPSTPTTRPEIAFSALEPVGPKTERTIILKNLNYDVNEEAVFNFFLPIGEIKDIRFAKDARKKNVSRGFCYVEFLKPESVLKALAMDRNELAGRPVFIEKEGHRESFYKGTGPGETRNKLFVRNLKPSVTEQELVDIFGKFEKMKKVDVVLNRSGQCKGFAYVEFGDAASASKAMKATNDTELSGRKVFVAISNPPAHSPKPLHDFNMKTTAISPVTESRKSRSHVMLEPRSVSLKTGSDRPASNLPASNGAAMPPPQLPAKKDNQYFQSLLQKKS